LLFFNGDPHFGLIFLEELRVHGFFVVACYIGGYQGQRLQKRKIDLIFYVPQILDLS